MIPASVRIFVCTRPHDMRCSYDTLALATQKVLGQDPRSGALFVFANKRHNRRSPRRACTWRCRSGLSCRKRHTPETPGGNPRTLRG